MAIWYKKYFRVNFLFKNLLVPLALLALYCSIFAYFSGHLLPAGVNYEFTVRLRKYTLLLLGIAAVALFIAHKFNKEEKLRLKNDVEKISAGDFFLLLLPLTIVTQYIIKNWENLSLLDSAIILALFTFISGILMLIIPACLGSISSTRVLVSLGLAFAFTIINMASLSVNFNWFITGSLKIQVVYFCCVLIASWFIVGLKNKKTIFLVVALYFVVNNSVQLLSGENEADRASLAFSENQKLSFFEERIPKSTPNIYLLVYDSYVINETMLAYGIDNSSQEKYLIERNFILYPHTYSVGAATLESMNRVLDMSVAGENQNGVSGNGIVQKALRDLDYTTYGIFPNDFMFRMAGSSYDFSFPPSKSVPSYIHLISAILIGEFRFDISFESLNYDQFVETKQQILASIFDDRVFLYAHASKPGHSQNSGVCLPNEVELFKQRLTSANIEMQLDIQTIIENDPEAIIIIAGDHGPYLTKNCIDTSGDYDISEISRLDIQDRFGSFLAIRWPTEDYTQYDEITVLQDVFAAIFAYIYHDKSALNLRIEPEILNNSIISGVSVKNNIIYGGINDGEPLFMSGQ